MRDRLQDARAQRVGLGHHRGLGRLGLQPACLERDRQRGDEDIEHDGGPAAHGRRPEHDDRATVGAQVVRRAVRGRGRDGSPARASTSQRRRRRVAAPRARRRRPGAEQLEQVRQRVGHLASTAERPGERLGLGAGPAAPRAIGGAHGPSAWRRARRRRRRPRARTGSRARRWERADRIHQEVVDRPAPATARRRRRDQRRRAQRPPARARAPAGPRWPGRCPSSNGPHEGDEQRQPDDAASPRRDELPGRRHERPASAATWPTAAGRPVASVGSFEMHVDVEVPGQAEQPVHDRSAADLVPAGPPGGAEHDLGGALGCAKLHQGLGRRRRRRPRGTCRRAPPAAGGVSTSAPSACSTRPSLDTTCTPTRSPPTRPAMRAARRISARCPARR